MTSIINIGMDVHSTNYTMCAYTFAGQQAFGRTVLNPDVNEVVKYLKTLEEQMGGGCEFVCGYEAGCLGYSLYRQLTSKGDPLRDPGPNYDAGLSQGKGDQNRQARRTEDCAVFDLWNLQRSTSSHSGG